MVLDIQRVTAAEFERFIRKPENISRNFELIAGEIVEKTVSSPCSSEIGMHIGGRLSVWAEDRGLGIVTGADGGYIVNGERYIPDAAFISEVRQPIQPSDAYNPLAPDLAVEVLSPTDDRDEILVKVGNYVAAGTLTWVVNPDKRRVEVYQSGQPPRILAGDEILDGGDAFIVPGFSLVVSTLFAE